MGDLDIIKLRSALQTVLAIALPFSAGLACARAESISTLSDVFGESQAGCIYYTNAPYSTCDVIGSPSTFDIEKAEVSIDSDVTRVRLFMNYGGGAGLSPFHEALDLSIGDLFFYNPAHPGWYSYGVPLHSHDAFTAGNVYQIGGGIVTRTAQEVLRSTDYYYRRDQIVWLASSVPVSASQSGGSVSVAPYGDGVHDARYSVTIQFTNPAGFYQNLLSNGEIGIDFSAATCANDVIRGTVIANPEPGSGILLIGGGLILAAKYHKRLFPYVFHQ